MIDGVGLKLVVIPALGAAYAVATIPDFDLSWLIEPKHAISIVLGLIGGFCFQLAINLHPETETKLNIWKIMLAHSVASVFNFFLAAGITATFAGMKPPPYLAIVMIAVLIGASGTKSGTLAIKQFQKMRFGDNGNVDKSKPPE